MLLDAFFGIFLANYTEQLPYRCYDKITYKLLII